MAGVPQPELVQDATRTEADGRYPTAASVERMIRIASIISVKAMHGRPFDPDQPVSGEMHGVAYDGKLSEVTARYCTIDHLMHDWPKGAVAYLTGITAPKG